MHLTTDEEFANMDLNEVQQKLRNLGEFSDNSETLEELLIKLKKMERTRYFAFWHDGSTIGNHSHLLVTVNVLYDPASFLSDEEYYLKCTKNINVQATIEEPQLYLLARCPSNDQQILYSEERVTDLLKMQKPIQCLNGVMINDVARFFKGDSPALQFEAGQQKGGNFFCTSCSIHSNHVKNI